MIWENSPHGAPSNSETMMRPLTGAPAMGPAPPWLPLPPQPAMATTSRTTTLREILTMLLQYAFRFIFMSDPNGEDAKGNEY